MNKTAGLLRPGSADFRRLRNAADPLQPQRLAVTILGGHARDGQLVWSGGLVKALSEFGFSKGAARVALGRLVRSDLLARAKEGRFVYYTLTDQATELMSEGDRRLFSFGRQTRDANSWTLVWHSVPEKQRLQRARLARRLRFLGFGSVQDGTWVAPHNMEDEVTELLQSLEIAEFSGVLIGKPAKSVNFEALIRRAWDLEELSERYQAFINALTPFLGSTVTEDNRNAFIVRTLMVDVFRGFPSQDPELISDSVGVDKMRDTAVRIFDDLFNTLKPPAQRHFDHLTRTASG